MRNRIPGTVDLAQQLQRFVQCSAVVVQVGLGQALQQVVVQRRQIAGDLAAGFMVQRAVEVGDDRACFADRLALAGLIALLEGGLGTAYALQCAGQQQRHQFVRIGIGDRTGHTHLAVLLGVLTAGTVHS